MFLSCPALLNHTTFLCSSECLQLQDEFELDEVDKKDSEEPETEVTEPRDVPNAFVVEVQSDDGVVLSSTQAYPASQVKKIK